MDMRTCFEAGKKLTSTSDAVRSPSEEKEPLIKRLESNISAYRSLLKDPKFHELSTRLEHHKSTSKVQLLLSKRKDLVISLYNEFTIEALGLLAVLDSVLYSLNEQDKLEKRTEANRAPVAPRAVLSVNDQKTLGILLEFIVSLGIYPYLIPGVDALLELRLKHAKSISKAANFHVDYRERWLHHSCSVIVKSFQNEVIGPSLLTRHLSDILAALIQVCYARKREPDIAKSPDSVTMCREQKIVQPSDICFVETEYSKEVIKDNCAEMLQRLLTRTYQPLVVKELLVLQSTCAGIKVRAASGGAAPSKCQSGGNNLKWLRRACGQLLSGRLMSKNGVRSVLEGIIEVTTGGGTDWNKCKAVANIIASCPSQASSMEDYYSLVCPQVLELVHMPLEKEYYLRVAVETISSMMSQNEALSDLHLFKPLMQSLIYLAEGHQGSGSVSIDIQMCVCDLHKVCSVAQPSSKLLLSFFPYLPLLFEIWQVESSNSRMSGCVKQVLVKVLNSVTRSEIISFLCCVCNIPKQSTKTFMTLNSGLMLSSTGSPPELTIAHKSESEELDLMESIGQHVIQLLQSDLNSDGLVGSFFIECLNHLASILCQDAKVDKQVSSESNLSPSSVSSSALLECENNMPRSDSEVIHVASTLYITAALCEHMSEQVIKEMDLPSFLETCRIIMRCHAKFLDSTSGRGVVQILESADAKEIIGGPVTLNIVLGMLSAILGENREMKRDDRDVLVSMTQFLNTIAAKCPDPELCSLAGDLSICISTLGAVWSTEMREHAADFKLGKKLIKKAEKEKHAIQGHGEKKEIKSSSYEEALHNLDNPLVPMKGYALVTLTKLVESKDEETLSNSPALLQIFTDSLSHSDSYVYLAAINGLVALALSKQSVSELVLTTICQEYASLGGRPNPKGRCDYDRETGGLAAKETSKPKEPLKRHSVETRMKLGESLVRVFQRLKDIFPHYLDDIVASLLTAVKDPDPLICASSLSNIAQVCSAGEITLSSVTTEVLSCVKHILCSEKEVTVRRAALVVLKHIVKGSQSTSVQDWAEPLLEVYRLLKQVERSEKDDLTRDHAQAALGELDKVMRDFIFPKQGKMEKKITVLN